ncbi:hypothetical protein [Phenylobacterium sp.]|jgi:hypothetical protein|uniref:hypothetical protein n=1 Tax=Phenylobacterium sp. TaxID=1871053 RepID=UPI002F41460A
MSLSGEGAASMVASALSRRAAPVRAEFLRELLAYAAAGLAVIETPPAAAEALYRLADAVVEHGPP